VEASLIQRYYRNYSECGVLKCYRKYFDWVKVDGEIYTFPLLWQTKMIFHWNTNKNVLKIIQSSSFVASIHCYTIDSNFMIWLKNYRFYLTGCWLYLSTKIWITNYWIIYCYSVRFKYHRIKNEVIDINKKWREDVFI
jgi:hypothetical protein